MRRTPVDTSRVRTSHDLSHATETRFPGHRLTSSQDGRFLEQVAALRKLEATLLQPGVDLSSNAALQDLMDEYDGLFRRQRSG